MTSAQTSDRPVLESMPTFEAFYRAIKGVIRSPWQARMAAQVATAEKWPVEVGVPTGLGKTACLDIAVWWLASQADRAPTRRTAPTRIWWARQSAVIGRCRHRTCRSDCHSAQRSLDAGTRWPVGQSPGNGC